MRVRAGVLAIGVLAGCAAMAGAATDAATAPVSRLRAFDGCPEFRAYVARQALPLVGPYGLDGTFAGARVGPLPPSAVGDTVGRTAADAFSGTNVQEEGVDEPDLVKTNGRHAFVVIGDRVRAVDVRARPRLVGTLRLARGGSNELLLHGDRLLVLSRVAMLPDARRPGGDPRAVRPDAIGRHRGRRRRPGAHARPPDARARGNPPRRSARRPLRADRPLRVAGNRTEVRAARRHRRRRRRRGSRRGTPRSSATPTRGAGSRRTPCGRRAARRQPPARSSSAATSGGRRRSQASGSSRC